MIENTLQKQLRKKLEESGHTMKSLSKAAGKNETYVRDILEGRVKNPSYENLKYLAAALGCDVGELVDGAGGGLAERGSNPFRKNTAANINSASGDGIDPEMLVKATLVVREAFEEEYGKLPNTQDIKDIAMQACEFAASAGTNIITKHLILYLLDIQHTSNKKLK